MIAWKRYPIALMGLAVLSNGIWIASAEAKPGNGKKGTPPATLVVPPARIVNPSLPDGTQFLTLSSSQRTLLVDLLRGRTVRNDLLTSSTRTQILNQVSSLPPGIQKQLLQGKGLPPGIAKKVFLPRQVNNYLNLPTRYNLVAIGSNLVVLDSVTSVVVDLLTNVF